MASEQTIFARLESVIKDQEKLIKSLTEKLEQLEVGIGGGGGTSIYPALEEAYNQYKI